MRFLSSLRRFFSVEERAHSGRKLGSLTLLAVAKAGSGSELASGSVMSMIGRPSSLTSYAYCVHSIYKTKIISERHTSPFSFRRAESGIMSSPRSSPSLSDTFRTWLELLFPSSFVSAPGASESRSAWRAVRTESESRQICQRGRALRNLIPSARLSLKLFADPATGELAILRGL